MVSHIFSETTLSHIFPDVHCSLLLPWSQLRISGHADATALPRPTTSGDDAVDGGPCTQSLYRPLLSEACIQYKASKATCDLYAGQ